MSTEVTKSPTLNLPTAHSIRRRHNPHSLTPKDIGCPRKGKSSGRPRTSNDNVEQIRRGLVRSPQKSCVRSCIRETRRRLRCKPYEFLNDHSHHHSDRSAGRCSADGATFCSWPPQLVRRTLQSATFFFFFSLGLHTNQRLCTRPSKWLSMNWKCRITGAVLQRVYGEFEYRPDVRRASKAASHWTFANITTNTQCHRLTCKTHPYSNLKPDESFCWTPSPKLLY